MRPHLCIVVVLLHSFPLKKVCWQSVGTMQFTSGLSFVLYNNFSLAAQCTVELGMPAACQGGSCIKCLDLYSDIYSLEQIRIISKPHMFAGMKEPFFGVIPIGATQDIDYAQCGWVVASGHSETLCSYFGCRLAPLLTSAVILNNRRQLNPSLPSTYSSSKQQKLSPVPLSSLVLESSHHLAYH
jgi:hypothetical protein